MGWGWNGMEWDGMGRNMSILNLPFYIIYLIWSNPYKYENEYSNMIME